MCVFKDNYVLLIMLPLVCECVCERVSERLKHCKALLDKSTKTVAITYLPKPACFTRKSSLLLNAMKTAVRKM